MKINLSFVQFIKYGIVGLGNTLLTAVVIWVILKFVFGITGNVEASPVMMSVSNVCGYIVGLINSYVFNRSWTFKSTTSWKQSFLKFVMGFAVCYIIQLGVVLAVHQSGLISPVRYREYTLTSAYLCQLTGIVSYTILNFLYNKYYAFRK
ncbi:MAG: GtrA family protein [Dysgonamonadaceae bacterium]|jgi:putative flippase GtrA|nr:GtrA family protein [Dysgonamonadaceae bacterium]